MTRDRSSVEREFRFFAGMCEGKSPLYAALATGIAGDPDAQALVESRAQRQSPANLLLGSVHDLLLGGVEHPLSGYYPSVGGHRPPEDVYPVFADFCRTFDREIRERVTQRRVQTNEVGRCGALLLAIALAWERFDRRPLQICELGASIGLGLLFDRYAYTFATEDGGEARCGPDSPVHMRVALLGTATFRPPRAIPVVRDRLGIDLAPVDVLDEDATRWVEAMIWADQMERIGLFRAAVALARGSPPPILAGDGLELLPDILAGAAGDVVPCVVHSRAIYQMSRDWRGRFAAMLDDVGARRDLARVSLEWLGDDAGPRLELSTYANGRRETTSLADCDDHGAWIRWHA